MEKIIENENKLIEESVKGNNEKGVVFSVDPEASDSSSFSKTPASNLPLHLLPKEGSSDPSPHLSAHVDKQIVLSQVWKTHFS